MDISINKNVEGFITLKKLFIESIKFNRSDNIKDIEISIGFEKSFHLIEDNKCRVEFACIIKDTDGKFDLNVKGIGLFLSINNDILHFKQNMLAIMFPFLRSQVTIITSQPDLEPIIIPVININALLEAK